MRTKATDSAAEDGWRGARIGAEVRDRQRRAARRIPAAIDIGDPGPARVTMAFLAVTILVTILEFAAFGTSPTTSELSRAGGAGIGVVATGAWWKLLVSNLLHASLVHVAMNAFVIFLTGRWLEHLVGPWVVAAAITWSLVLSGIGSILVDAPTVSIGASGVAFGLVGCAIAADPRARTPTGVIGRQLGIVNVVITFIAPGISIGGHLGGLTAGLVVGALCWNRSTDDEKHPAGRIRRGWAPALIALSTVPIVVMALGPHPADLAAGPRARITASLLSRQLSGTQLTGGLKVHDAECEPGSDLRTYVCDVDGRSAIVTFDDHDDQWSLQLA